MTREPEAGRLAHGVAAMMALETQNEALLDRLRGAARGHSGTAAAFERFRATARDHRDGLGSHLRDLRQNAGLPDDLDAAGSPPAAPHGAGKGDEGTEGDQVCTGAVSQALREVYLACNDAAFGYGVLHEIAHLCDSLRYAATLRLAQQHLRHYAAAAQEINQLLAEVVAWELRHAGQFCNCQSPACALGICWCIANTTDAINQAWRETAPAYPSAGLRVAPNPRRPPDLDVREGDLVIAVDGQRVATTADVTNAVLRRAPGEPITFGIERPSAGTLEVTAIRR